MCKVQNHFTVESESGFSYIEVLIAMAIFAISVIPILSMIFNASQNTVSGRRYYEATIMVQNLSERIKNEIERRLVNNEPLGEGTAPQSLALFLNPSDTNYSKFNDAFNGDEYEYDVYIKKTDGSDQYKLLKENNYNYDYLFVHINRGETSPTEPSLMPDPITELDLTGQNSDPGIFDTFIEGDLPTDSMELEFDGTDDWDIIKSNSPDKSKIDLTWNDFNDFPSCVMVVSNPLSPNPTLETDDRIEISLDVSKLQEEHRLDIRLENNTKATIIFYIYRGNKVDVKTLDKNIEVFPIQNDPDGNIFIERKTKMIPRENYIIRIVARDRKKHSKILKDMVDIYSHDYRIAAY